VCTVSQTALLTTYFSARLKQWREGADIQMSYTPHSLRRGRATDLAKAGVEQEVIRNLGGWKGDMSHVYQQLSAMEWAEAASQASSRKKKRRKKAKKERKRKKKKEAKETTLSKVARVLKHS